MNVSQGGGHYVSDRAEKPGNSMADPASTTRVQFTDVDWPFHTILFVEDEPGVLRARRQLFEPLGFSVLTADCENKALSLLRLAPVDAVVVDYPLGGTGTERIVSKIREANVGLQIVLLSSRHAIPKSLVKIVDLSVDKFAGPQALLIALEELLQVCE